MTRQQVGRLRHPLQGKHGRVGPEPSHLDHNPTNPWSYNPTNLQGYGASRWKQFQCHCCIFQSLGKRVQMDGKECSAPCFDAKGTVLKPSRAFRMDSAFQSLDSPKMASLKLNQKRSSFKKFHCGWICHDVAHNVETWCILPNRIFLLLILRFFFIMNIYKTVFEEALMFWEHFILPSCPCWVNIRGANRSNLFRRARNQRTTLLLPIDASRSEWLKTEAENSKDVLSFCLCLLWAIQSAKLAHGFSI